MEYRTTKSLHKTFEKLRLSSMFPKLYTGTYQMLTSSLHFISVFLKYRAIISHDCLFLQHQRDHVPITHSGIKITKLDILPHSSLFRKVALSSSIHQSAIHIVNTLHYCSTKSSPSIPATLSIIHKRMVRTFNNIPLLRVTEVVSSIIHYFVQGYRPIIR
jgi:hypothetical protein